MCTCCEKSDLSRLTPVFEAFALAAQLGALAAGADDEPYRRWGLAYGVLFQINDDIADLGATDTLHVLKGEWEGRLAAISHETGFTFPES